MRQRHMWAGLSGLLLMAACADGSVAEPSVTADDQEDRET